MDNFTYDIDTFQFGFEDKTYDYDADNEPYMINGVMHYPDPRRPADWGFNATWVETGRASSDQIEQFEKEYKIFRDSGVFNETELADMEEIRDDLLSGNLDPWGAEVDFKYYRQEKCHRL